MFVVNFNLHARRGIRNGKRVPAEVATPVGVLISDGAMPNEEFEIYVTSASCCRSFVCRHRPGPKNNNPLQEVINDGNWYLLSNWNAAHQAACGLT